MLGLSVLAAALAATGCFFPVPMVEESVDNQAPFVSEDDVEPNKLYPFSSLTVERDEITFFSIAHVVDPDVDDHLFARWFIDYERRRKLSQPDSVAPSGTALRTMRWQFARDPCGDPALQGKDDAFLECVIADRPFLSQEAEDPDRPDRSLPEDARTTTLTWHLLFEGACTR